MFSDENLTKLFDVAIFLDVSKETCLQRRLQKDEWLQENPTYFGNLFKLPSTNINRQMCVAILYYPHLSTQSTRWYARCGRRASNRPSISDSETNSTQFYVITLAIKLLPYDQIDILEVQFVV